MKMINGFPRRGQMDHFTKEEQAIWDVTQMIESYGCHPLLTDAVVLLGKAREKVADFIDLNDPNAIPQAATTGEAKCTCGSEGEKGKHHESYCPVWKKYEAELNEMCNRFGTPSPAKPEATLEELHTKMESLCNGMGDILLRVTALEQWRASVDKVIAGEMETKPSPAEGTFDAKKMVDDFDWYGAKGSALEAFAQCCYGTGKAEAESSGHIKGIANASYEQGKTDERKRLEVVTEEQYKKYNADPNSAIGIILSAIRSGGVA